MSPTSELPLYVAAGGGGDVLGALMVAIGEGRAPESLHIATFAWERKRFDPRLGPRAVDDFRDLRAPADDVWQVTPASRLRSGRSFLPALVSAARCNLYLLDPTRGVCGLRRQLAALGDYLGAEITVLVDVGGDILAEGGESGLRSPTADAMALAAAYGTSRPSSVLVLGLGLDGELTRAQWRAACGSAADARREPEPVTSLQASAADFIRPLLDWHPSEVAGLACPPPWATVATPRCAPTGCRSGSIVTPLVCTLSSTHGSWRATASPRLSATPAAWRRSRQR